MSCSTCNWLYFPETKQARKKEEYFHLVEWLSVQIATVRADYST